MLDLVKLLSLSVLMAHTVVDARYLEKAILIPVNTQVRTFLEI